MLTLRVGLAPLHGDCSCDRCTDWLIRSRVRSLLDAGADTVAIIDSLHAIVVEIEDAIIDEAQTQEQESLV